MLALAIPPMPLATLPNPLAQLMAVLPLSSC